MLYARYEIINLIFLNCFLKKKSTTGHLDSKVDKLFYADTIALVGQNDIWFALVIEDSPISTNEVKIKWFDKKIIKKRIDKEEMKKTSKNVFVLKSEEVVIDKSTVICKGILFYVRIDLLII